MPSFAFAQKMIKVKTEVMLPVRQVALMVRNGQKM